MARQWWTFGSKKKKKKKNAREPDQSHPQKAVNNITDHKNDMLF